MVIIMLINCIYFLFLNMLKVREFGGEIIVKNSFKMFLEIRKFRIKILVFFNLEIF